MVRGRQASEGNRSPHGERTVTDRAIYEFKVFQAPTDKKNVSVINSLLETIHEHGWEAVEVNVEKMYIVAKRKKFTILND